MPKVEKTHLYRITKEWKADEVTWLMPKAGNKMWNPGEDTLEQGGAYTTDNSAETDYAEPENWEEYDITVMLKYFIDNPNENFGFILISDEEMNNTQRAYASSDFTDDISQRPKLTIETETAITYFPQKGLKNKISLKITNSAISFSLPFKNYRVTISNAKGQKTIHLEESLSDNYKIPLSKFSTGVHFLNIKHDNRSETIKFIVAK